MPLPVGNGQFASDFRENLVFCKQIENNEFRKVERNPTLEGLILVTPTSEGVEARKL